MGKFTHFFFDQEAVPSLYTDSMNLVHQQWGDLSQSNNEVTTNCGKEKIEKKPTFGPSGYRLGDGIIEWLMGVEFM